MLQLLTDLSQSIGLMLAAIAIIATNKRISALGEEKKPKG